MANRLLISATIQRVWKLENADRDIFQSESTCRREGDREKLVEQLGELKKNEKNE